MLRPIYKVLVLAALVIGMCSVSGPEAEAGWRHGGYLPAYGYGVGWGCGYDCGCWSSCCDPCCGSDWALGWRRGPIRRALFGRYKWYPAAWGSYACCDSVVAEPCCSDGTVIGTTGPAVTVPQETRPTLAPQRAVPSAPTPGPVPNSSRSFEQQMDSLMPGAPKSTTPKPPANPSTNDQSLLRNSGLLSVHVPDAAKVYINGRETRSEGERREYVSHGLKTGKVYPYTVRALVLAKDGSAGESSSEGRMVWITKTVYLRAGDRIAVTISDNVNLESQLAQVEPAEFR